jgi:geranylgeranyl diphosphate synthase, type II
MPLPLRKIWYMQALEALNKLLSIHLNNLQFPQEPAGLYQPIEYILKLGGKRVRPLLTLLTTELFGEDAEKAIDAALAVELFHNFSLIHDDIMDDAPLRRGQLTVHEKWNINTGILSGDAMLILAYRYFEQYEPKVFRELAKLFTKTALEVCEGQQWDVDFENRTDVDITEYLKMIEYKTAVLIGAAMKMGAIIANASEKDQQLIYDFGVNLGIAFQIQDDYLDAFGNPETFGKQVGGDIIENKKTFLYIHAQAQGANQGLHQWSGDKNIDVEEKITAVKSIFDQFGASKAAVEAIERYTHMAFDCLHHIDLSDQKKQILREFGLELMNRKV